ncbi:transposase [Coraliomargarita sp. SDUM461004]|uniref:Transposase n=1 Tax=Thalassobacterium sedimentorum TaxID=3041258 RepID=A0ABU1AI33_9BACT|nr:transposase [Coraliomargarita sp. SDUM461004]MDQ8194431.1 transposase [Coraliomargarita sp. SDUM461004]
MPVPTFVVYISSRDCLSGWMRANRVKVIGSTASYHCMTRTVNGESLFGQREQEVLRKMIWQVADFCGVNVLTYCVMSNHFHVLVEVPEAQDVSDAELLQRYKVLYPQPTKYQEASIKVLAADLAAGGEAAEAIRQRLLLRMGDVSEFMKTVKQRFTIWYNKSHQRFGTLWADRFKSVLVEGAGNALQTVAAYIDLNPVRAGIVADPKDYRCCGYAQAVAGDERACDGLLRIWSDHVGADRSPAAALQAHRSLIFGKGADPWEVKGRRMNRSQVAQVIEEQDGVLPRAAVLRCRVRYFTDGVILGSAEYVRGFVSTVQMECKRKHPPKVNALKGAAWGDMAVIRSLRETVFS